MEDVEEDNALTVLVRSRAHCSVLQPWLLAAYPSVVFDEWSSSNLNRGFAQGFTGCPLCHLLSPYHIVALPSILFIYFHSMAMPGSETFRDF